MRASIRSSPKEGWKDGVCCIEHLPGVWGRLAARGSCRDHFETLFRLGSQVPGALDGLPQFYAVTAFTLQHPDEFCTPSRLLAELRASVADALAGRATRESIDLRLARAGAQAGRGSGKATARRRVTKWPMTIVDVCAGGVEGYTERVQRWAQSVWESLDAAAAEPSAAEASTAADPSSKDESPDDPLRARGITIHDSAEPVNSDQLDRIERSLNLRLPAEYRSFLLRANGGVPNSRLFHYIAIDEEEGTRRRQKGRIARFYAASLANPRGVEPNSFVTIYQNNVPDFWPDWLLPIAEVEDWLEGGVLCSAVKGENRGRIYFYPEQEIGEETLHKVADSFNSFLALLGQ